MYLNINGQQVGDEVFSTLCRSLCVNTTLIGLKFADNNLSTNGYIAFEQMLLQNKTLQFINFINDPQAFYEKFSSEKNAGDLLLELHECCILRRSGNFLFLFYCIFLSFAFSFLSFFLSFFLPFFAFFFDL